jgi:DnaJ-class molecular chaperone
MKSCERCQGNGEIVTDWERYLESDEGTAECPDCDGTGEIEDEPS